MHNLGFNPALLLHFQLMQSAAAALALKCQSLNNQAYGFKAGTLKLLPHWVGALH